jgi:chromosome partitioning protein
MLNRAREPIVILAVANRKGGTGKTTTAVNFAAMWAERGLRTLLVDMDTQGHAAIGLGIAFARGQGCLHRIFKDPDYDLSRAIVGTEHDNLWLIPACRDYEGRSLGGDYLALQKRLRAPALKARFDRIILDTPPTLDHVLLNALAAADGLLVPFLPHHLASVGVRQLAGLYYRVASRDNHKLRFLGLVPVMADERMTLHRKVIKDLREQFGQQKMLGGIRHNIRLAEAFAVGQPICVFAPNSPGAEDYINLCTQFEQLLSGSVSLGAARPTILKG